MVDTIQKKVHTDLNLMFSKSCCALLNNMSKQCYSIWRTKLQNVGRISLTEQIEAQKLLTPNAFKAVSWKLKSTVSSILATCTNKLPNSAGYDIKLHRSLY